MKYSKTVMLKNQEECLLRNAEGADAEAVCQIFQLTHGQTDYMLSYPDENSFDVEQERAYLVQKAESPAEIEICAVLQGQIVGTAGIGAVGRKDKVKHRATLGIGVEKSHWGKGIGRALIEACIACAGSAGYLQLELEIVCENHAAVSLYESVGFQEYGRNPRGFRSRNSGWQELILMRLELN